MNICIGFGFLPVSPALGLSAGLGGGPGGGDGESLLDLLRSGDALGPENRDPSFRAGIVRPRPVEMTFLVDRGTSLALAI